MFDEKFIAALAPAVAARMQNGTAHAATVTPRLLSIDQAATYLGRSKTSVQHLVAQRRIPVVREGRRVFLDVRELDSWITSNSEPATPE